MSSSLDDQSGFLPVFRSGSCLEIWPKLYMEDEHICIDDIVDHLGTDANLSAPDAFLWGAFQFQINFLGDVDLMRTWWQCLGIDGHGGTDAAASASKNLLKFIIEDQYFPTSMEKAVRCAFVHGRSRI
ncbi:putative protein phosphatase 2C 27 [Platanthera guangdongensis]|uniref:protein-serine/threonine phosphatase n=1 Tax=Platanthera guangdongensis TaxID=2320717 RepID=A0ABR2MWV5_9ASPA